MCKSEYYGCGGADANALSGLEARASSKRGHYKQGGCADIGAASDCDGKTINDGALLGVLVGVLALICIHCG